MKGFLDTGSLPFIAPLRSYVKLGLPGRIIMTHQTIQGFTSPHTKVQVVLDSAWLDRRQGDPLQGQGENGVKCVNP